MPAAAVIPAPIAYIKAVAVKKLVVESRDEINLGPPKARCVAGLFISTFWSSRSPRWFGLGMIRGNIYLYNK